MANKNNVTLTNLVSGELSQEMSGRVDLELFQKSLAFCKNWVVLPQGGLRYRAGSFFIAPTKFSGPGALIPFQFSANDAYMIVATDKAFRYYRNGGAVLDEPITITAVNKLVSPVNFTTSAPHGFNEWDTVYLEGVPGSHGLNGRPLNVRIDTSTKFFLFDEFGESIYIPTSDITAGGTVSRVYETETPYIDPYLQELRTAQIADVMTIVHQRWEPRELIREGHNDWTLDTFTRTNDPFATTPRDVDAMTIAAEAVFTTATNHGYEVGQRVYWVGNNIPQLEGKFLIVKSVPNPDEFTAYYEDGVTVVDSTGWSYASGDQVEYGDRWPACVMHTADSRRAYANTLRNPEGLWESRTPDNDETRFNDFTLGSNDTHAVAFNFAPANDLVDEIQELARFGRAFNLLGASSIRKVYGANEDVPITPTVVNTQATIEGCAKVKPVIVAQTMLFVDVSKSKLKAYGYNLSKDDFETKDYTLVAQHLGERYEFKKVVRLKDNPDSIWVLRSDGVLLSFTFNPGENIAGWARHVVGGPGAVVEDIATIRQPGGTDQLWMIVKRDTTPRPDAYPGGGAPVGLHNVIRTVEVVSDYPVFPEKRAFYTGKDNRAADMQRWANATFNRLRDHSFLDCALTYDGDATFSITGDGATAEAGEECAFTSAGAFTEDMVGKQIWRVHETDGSGSGRAEITEFTDSSNIVCEIIEPFDTDEVGLKWELAVTEVSGLYLLEGQTVGVQMDGGSHDDCVVEDAKISLNWHGAHIRVGFRYMAFMASQNIDIGGQSGPANSKWRNLYNVKPRFSNSMGCQFGPDEYRVKEILFTQGNDNTLRPQLPFTGIQEAMLLSLWNRDSTSFVAVHDRPVPCTIVAVDCEVATVDQT